jgi:putative membrane protein
MWGHMSTNYGWGWGGMGLGMLLFWGVFIAVIAVLLKYTAGRNSSGSSRANALDILKERYARGEIDRDEYEQKKRDLSE